MGIMGLLLPRNADVSQCGASRAPMLWNDKTRERRTGDLHSQATMMEGRGKEG